MINSVVCPKCHSDKANPDGIFVICPDCGHEWTDDSDESIANI